MCNAFIIPGFPFITSGIDLSKLDMRSGIERLTYALIIIIVATMTAWLMALILHLTPMDFCLCTLPYGSSYCSDLRQVSAGFSDFPLCSTALSSLQPSAAVIGALANTLRLELVDLVSFPPAAAAFVGAFTAGILMLAAEKVCGLSENIHHRSVHSHNGSGIISLQGFL